MLFLIILPCILCFVYAWRRRQKYLAGKLPPVCIGTWPVVGQIHLWIRRAFWSRILEMQRYCLEQGGITYLYTGINPSYTHYALADPIDISKVANECHQKALILEDSVKAVFGEGLATAPVSVWEKHRQLLEPVYDQIRTVEATNYHAKRLVDNLRTITGAGLLGHTEYLRETTMAVLFSLIFGITKEKDEKSTDTRIKTYQSALQEVSDVLFERYQSFFTHKALFFNCSRLKQRQNECVRVIKTLSNEVISTRREELNNKESTDSDTTNNSQGTSTCLLDALLNLEAQDLYSDQHVTDEVITAMFGGYETLANALTFVLMLLGSHPGVQDRVYLEIKNLSNNKNDIDINELAKLVYLEAVIMESLRLYPPVSTISRVSNNSMEIKKYTLDPGSQCLLFIYGMNRHASWGPDCEAFRPDRWLEPSVRPDCGTFGIGKRSCIGKKVALNTIKIVVAHILREYKIVSDYTKMKVTQRILLTPLSGHHIALELRNNNSNGQNNVININDK